MEIGNIFLLVVGAFMIVAAVWSLAVKVNEILPYPGDPIVIAVFGAWALSEAVALV